MSDAREDEHAFDRTVAWERARIDREIVQSGAVARLRERILARRPAGAFAGMRWQSVAAAVLVAGMLGGAIDLMLPEPAVEQTEAAIADPFFALDGTDTR